MMTSGPHSPDRIPRSFLFIDLHMRVAFKKRHFNFERGSLSNGRSDAEFLFDWNMQPYSIETFRIIFALVFLPMHHPNMRVGMSRT